MTRHNIAHLSRLRIHSDSRRTPAPNSPCQRRFPNLGTTPHPQKTMAEAGSFAERVKQQADIVRIVGEYVRLKKTGQNFTGLCPFHQEKTPSFAVHPVRQIYHCFGCGVGGDIFQFVMEMEKSSFPEAVRTVAEKCGIAVPTPRERSPEERREQQQRTALGFSLPASSTKPPASGFSRPSSRVTLGRTECNLTR